MPEWATFPSVEDWAWVLGCGQRNDAWPEDWFLSLRARSSARFRVCRCFSAQVSHLVWSGTVGFGQSLQMPSFLASSRLAWAMRRRSSLRSGVWRLFRSYFRRFSSLASTCAGVGSTRGLGVLGVLDVTPHLATDNLERFQVLFDVKTSVPFQVNYRIQEPDPYNKILSGLMTANHPIDPREERTLRFPPETLKPRSPGNDTYVLWGAVGHVATDSRPVPEMHRFELHYRVLGNRLVETYRQQPPGH